MHAIISRVFRNGHSQVVRIPQELRLNTSRVEISQKDAGDLVIHPIPVDRGAVLLVALEDFDAEYAEFLEDVLAEQPDGGEPHLNLRRALAAESSTPAQSEGADQLRLFQRPMHHRRGGAE